MSTLERRDAMLQRDGTAKESPDQQAYTAHMSLRTDETACPFNAQERDYIRRELDLFFGTLPSVADGFQLRTWRSGPLAGQPKLPPALRTMVDGGLMEIRIHPPNAALPARAGL